MLQGDRKGDDTIACPSSFTYAHQLRWVKHCSEKDQVSQCHNGVGWRVQRARRREKQSRFGIPAWLHPEMARTPSNVPPFQLSGTAHAQREMREGEVL